MLDNYTCLTSCPDGWFALTTGVCRLCDSTCKTCSVTSTNCASCNGNYILSSGTCINSCPDYTYLNTISLTCESCFDGCTKCSGPL